MSEMNLLSPALSPAPSGREGEETHAIDVPMMDIARCGEAPLLHSEWRRGRGEEARYCSTPPKTVICPHESHRHRPPPPSRPDARGKGIVARTGAGVSRVSSSAASIRKEIFPDFYPAARLSGTDGFQHGLPEHLQRDEERAKLQRRASKSCGSGIINGARTGGVLLEIWGGAASADGLREVMRKEQNIALRRAAGAVR